MSEQPTLTEVAAAAGVSPATASRVLTGTVRVSTSARRQVHDAIAELGYVRRRAQRHAPQRTNQHPVAAVICEPTNRLFHDPFFPRLLNGAEEALARHGTPLLMVSATPANAPHITSYLLAGGIAAAMLISAHGRHPLAISLPASRITVRSAGRLPAGLDVPFVDVDNRDGARQAVEHLLLRGRRSIAMIAGPPDLTAAADRLVGYRHAMEAAGRAAAPVAYGDFTHVSGAHAMGWLLNRMPRLDAVFVSSDLMASGAIQALHRAGRRVPDDVAVVGFDDAPLARMVNPALTTIRQPVEELGAITADLLFAAVSGQDVENHSPVLPTELIVRDSS